MALRYLNAASLLRALRGTPASNSTGMEPPSGTDQATGMPADFHMKPRAIHISEIQVSSAWKPAANASLDG